MKFSTEPDLDELMALISKLPGLGPKSARRIALYLLKNRDNVMQPLSKSLAKIELGTSTLVVMICSWKFPCPSIS